MKKININKGWKFSKIDNDICPYPLNSDIKTTDIDLPHTWYTDENQYRGRVLYQKHIQISEEWETLFLDFPAADQSAAVYADEIFLGSHKGGYSCFRFEIPDMVLKRRQFVLSVVLNNAYDETVSPLTGDFSIFGGLYRGVNLIPASKIHFDYLYYGTNGIIAHTDLNEDGSGSVYIEPHVTGNGLIRYSIFDASDNIILQQSASSDKVIALKLHNPVLWDGKKNPYIYRLCADLICNDITVDSSEIKIGFRKVQFDSEKGLFLNGELLRIKGVAKHADHGDCFNAVSNKHIEEDFRLIDEIGANAVRLSHYQHPSYAYDLADNGGYLVWAEIPLLKMIDNQQNFNNNELQLKELILQNIHHPSIFCWGIQNEVGMFRDSEFMHKELRKMYELAKELDPFRTVASANLYTVKAKSELNKITDIVGYNIYFGWYYGQMQDYNSYLDKLHAGCPGLPLGVSEYGVDCNTRLHSENPQIRDYSEEYQALYHETVYSIFESKPYLWGSFVWNMFDFASSVRDEGGIKSRNNKGLVSYDRKIKKDAFYYYKAKWSSEAFIHICQKRFVNRNRDTISIKIYTNLKKAELFSGGISISSEYAENGTIVFKNVILQPGENIFTVIGNEGISDSAVFYKIENEDTDYKLPKTSEGSHVKNWFLQNDDIVREGYFSIEDSANELLENPKANEILKSCLPKLYYLMTEKDFIPLGLSLKAILSRSSDEYTDIIALNKELNKIKSEV